MKKNEFVSLISEILTEKGNPVDKGDIVNVVNAYDEAILDIISREDEIRTGWGKIWGETKPAHAARNPATGETIQVPEKHGQPKCRFSKAAKDV